MTAADSLDTFDVTIATPAEVDFEELAAVVNAAYTVYPFMTGPRTDAEMVKEEAGDSGIFILARDGAGLLVGCAMVKASVEVDWAYAEGMEPGAEDALYFGLAGVLPAGQRGGVGRTLLERAETIARERGYRRMVLTTLEEMGLLDYYGPKGYRTLDTRSFPGHDHWAIDIPHTLHAMEKVL